MQIIITHGSLARTRVLRLNRLQLAAGAALLVVLLMVLSGAIYHYVFLKAAEAGWPVVSRLVRLVVKDEFAQRDRFMRENLDAMARKVGEMQAKLLQLEAVGERVSGLAGLKPEEVRPEGGTSARPGEGGPFVPMVKPSLQELSLAVDRLDEAAQQNADLFTFAESRLFEQQLKALMVPNSPPVAVVSTSGFGFRSDPFSGRSALHTGLDFPAEPGTPIMASAGGVVIVSEYHSAYGNMVDVDHGNGLVTRYAHASRVMVKPGDIVRRGQVIAHVGSTGRSTGPHLHFEVLVAGVQQDPAKFLAGGGAAAPPAGLARRLQRDMAR